MITKKQEALLNKTADILGKLAEKCGGPGGKPGPCPTGVSTEPAAGGTKPAGEGKPKITGRTAGSAVTSKNIEFEGDHPPIKLPGALKSKTKARIDTQKKLAEGIQSQSPKGNPPDSDLNQRISGYEKLVKGEKIPNQQAKAIVADLMNSYNAANTGGGRTYAASKPKSKYASDMLSLFGIDAAETYKRVNSAPNHTPIHG